jgi:hypothetical protein
MRRNQMELALDATQAALAAALDGLPYGFLRLETWAPGDGWTRYRLMDNEGRKLSPYMRRSAMLDTLDALGRLAETMGKLKPASAAIAKARGEERC